MPKLALRPAPAAPPPEADLVTPPMGFPLPTEQPTQQPPEPPKEP